MASTKLILWKHDQKQNGQFPIAIRVTLNRKTKYIFTGIYVSEKEWNSKEEKVKSPHKNIGKTNATLKLKIAEINNYINKAELNDEKITLDQIKNLAKRKSNSSSFFEFAVERIKNKALEGTYSVAKSELSILYNIKEYLTHNSALPKYKVILEIKERRRKRVSNTRSGKTNFETELSEFSNTIDLSFEEIDSAFITRYKSFCSSYLEQKTRTITNQLIFIRTVYNQAIKENIASVKNYPFGGDKERIKIKSGNKIGLTKSEVRLIEALELERETPIWHTKNVWLFAFYFAGIRISDVLELKWSDFMDGRLYYQMNKNEKPVSLKIPDSAQNILILYAKHKTSNNDFVFPFLKNADENDKKDMFTKSRNATKLLNKYLKRIAIQCNIDKNLSNHIARHTFGNIAGDNIHPLMLQKLYRHSDLKTTLIYQSNFIHKEADEALESVLNS